MNNDNLNKIKNTGFTVPKDYFKDFEDTIMSQAKLKYGVSDSGFNTPEDYFENLEETILNKVAKKETTQVIQLFSKRNLIYLSGIAAAVLLLFNLSVFNKEITFDSLDFETVENYIINEELSSYEIASFLTDDDLLEENFIQDNFSDETIETYILDHLDIEDLISE